jgi:hypothetical protein
VRRYPVVNGRTGRCSKDDYRVLAEAIAAVSAEQRASVERFGPVPESEWPEDREIPWKVASLRFGGQPRRSSHALRGSPDVTPPGESSNRPDDSAYEPPTGDPMGGADPTDREAADE